MAVPQSALFKADESIPTCFAQEILVLYVQVRILAG
jgi:hypothetical protein